VLSKTYVYIGGTSYEETAWTVRAFDAFGNVTQEHRSTGEEREVTWGANCCGKESETDASGIQWTYDYDLLDRLIKDNKKNTAGTANALVREYTYDAADRRLTEGVSGSGLSMVTSSNTYDLAGRVVTSVDSRGIETTYTYSDGGRMTTVVRAGVTNETARYADGRTHYTERNGVRQQTYDYGVATAGGSQWTQVYTGPDGTSSPMYAKTTVDMLGRTIKRERPGFGGSTVIATYEHDNAGRLVRAATTGMADTLYEYDDMGNQTVFCLDVNGNGTNDLEGIDRVTQTDTYYEKDDGDWWRVTVSKVYTAAQSSLAATTGVQKVRLTGLNPSRIAELGYPLDWRYRNI